MTVEMADPKEVDAIKRRIRIKDPKIEAECLAAEIEEFIAGIPESMDGRSLNLYILRKDNARNKQLGYTKGRISQKHQKY